MSADQKFVQEKARTAQAAQVAQAAPTVMALGKLKLQAVGEKVGVTLKPEPILSLQDERDIYAELLMVLFQAQTILERECGKLKCIEPGSIDVEEANFYYEAAEKVFRAVFSQYCKLFTLNGLKCKDQKQRAEMETVVQVARAQNKERDMRLFLTGMAHTIERTDPKLSKTETGLQVQRSLEAFKKYLRTDNYKILENKMLLSKAAFAGFEKATSQLEAFKQSGSNKATSQLEASKKPGSNNEDITATLRQAAFDELQKGFQFEGRIPKYVFGYYVYAARLVNDFEIHRKLLPGMLHDPIEIEEQYDAEIQRHKRERQQAEGSVQASSGDEREKKGAVENVQTASVDERERKQAKDVVKTDPVEAAGSRLKEIERLNNKIKKLLALHDIKRRNSIFTMKQKLNEQEMELRAKKRDGICDLNPDAQEIEVLNLLMKFNVEIDKIICSEREILKSIIGLEQKPICRHHYQSLEESNADDGNEGNSPDKDQPKEDITQDTLLAAQSRLREINDLHLSMTVQIEQHNIMRRNDIHDVLKSLTPIALKQRKVVLRRGDGVTFESVPEETEITFLSSLVDSNNKFGTYLSQVREIVVGFFDDNAVKRIFADLPRPVLPSAPLASAGRPSSLISTADMDHKATKPSASGKHRI